MKRTISLGFAALFLAGCTQQSLLPEGSETAVAEQLSQDCVVGQPCDEDQTIYDYREDKSETDVGQGVTDAERDELLSVVDAQASENVVGASTEPRTDSEGGSEPRLEVQQPTPRPQPAQNNVSPEASPTPTETPVPDSYTISIAALKEIRSGSTLKFEIVVLHPTRTYGSNGSTFNVSYEAPGLLVNSGSDGWSTNQC